MRRKRASGRTPDHPRHRQSVHRMKLKDDPQLIGVEFSNEEEGCILWPNLKGTKVGPKEYALFDLRFREFLKKKYSDIASLNRAWKSNFTDFDAVHVPRYLLSECAKDSPVPAISSNAVPASRWR
ncbi:MAG: beta-galactosidase [Lentisphaeria bacterium]|nr:MAG: beta-galactosidase [Lentisphaeria bacterium]